MTGFVAGIFLVLYIVPTVFGLFLFVDTNGCEECFLVDFLSVVQYVEKVGPRIVVGKKFPGHIYIDREFAVHFLRALEDAEVGQELP